MSDKVSIVLIGQAITSLRDSDFDMASAVGEVVDNSLQAGATEIRLSLNEKELPVRGRRPAGIKQIVEVAFGDDGCGMNEDTLHRCLQLGYSTRYNDRTGIGRFGVGATLGAISQCTRVDIYSREKNSPHWLHTYIDLEEAKSNEFIPRPKKHEPPNEYASLVRQEHGTLVIWRRCDRLRGSREELEHWLARTYRKFIGTTIVRANRVVKNTSVKRIFIDDKAIEAFDPLYAVPNRDYPTGPKATLYDEMHLDVPVPPDAGISDRTSRVTIQMSLLPEAWRSEGGGRSGNSALAKQLRIADNQGFSVLRADREVFYDVMPHFEPVVHADGIDRWWGAEISFGPPLDYLFSIRNVKRGARFLKDLREKIQEQMEPTIQEARREVKQTFNTAKFTQSINGHNVATEHTEAEKIVQLVNPPAGKAGMDKTEEEKKHEIKEILRESIGNDEELDAWRAKIEGQPVTIVDDQTASWHGATFLDIHPQGGSTILRYNRRHDFFVFVYNTIKALEADASKGNEESAVEHAKKLKIAIDFLFMAYTQAVVQLKSEQIQCVGDTREFLEMNWGLFLRQFMKSYEKGS